VSGSEPDQVRKIAFDVAQVLSSEPTVENVNYNWMEPARTIRIRVDQDQARLVGLNSQDLAVSLNTVVSGITATQVRSGIYLVDVLIRASAEQRMSLSTIRTIMGGLAVATVLTLVFLPALYVAWFRIKRPDQATSKNMDLRQTAMVSA
jgi:multidrug efflux pump subunit AcrB